MLWDKRKGSLLQEILFLLVFLLVIILLFPSVSAAAPPPPSYLDAIGIDGGIQLNWSEDAESGVAGYKIHYGTVSGNLTETVIFETTATGEVSYDLTGLADCTDYYVAVSAYDSSGNESTFSYEIKVTSGQAGPPSAPTGITATAEDGAIVLGWNSNPECDILWYDIYRSTASGTGYVYLGRAYNWANIKDGLEALPGNTTYYRDGEISDGITYYYIIKAVDGSGNESPASEEVSVTAVDTIPPADVYQVVASPIDSGIRIQWHHSPVPDMAGFKIRYGSAADNLTETVIYEPDSFGWLGSYDLTGLSDCTDYYISMLAYDLSGNESTPSPPVKGTSGQAGPPSAPTGITATAEDGAIVLGWSQNAECDIAGYHVYRSTVSGSGYERIDYINSPSVTTYRDGNIADGTTYYYIIKAVDGSGNESPASEEVSVTALDTTSPVSPENLYVWSADSGIRIRWYQPATADIAGYKIHYGTASGVYTQTVTYSQTATGYLYYTLTGLEDCTDYYIAVSAYDLSGNESALSREAAGTSGQAGPPSAPTGITVTAEDGAIVLGWNSNPECDAMGYRVYRSTTSGGPYQQIADYPDISGTTYRDEKVVDGTIYYYVVTTLDNFGNESTFSLEVSATAVDKTPPPVPYGLYVSQLDNGLFLWWNEEWTEDIAGYKIYYGTESGIYTQTITYEHPDAGWWLSHTLTGLEDCTDYYIAVSAYDLSGNESVLSQEAAGTSGQAGPPSAPTGITATAEDGAIVLGWSPNTECDVGSYTVYRRTTTGGGYQKIRSWLHETTFRDEQIASGTTYYYVITAGDRFGNWSAYSQEVSATAIDTTPPPQPEGLTLYKTDTGVQLRWYQPPAADIAGYKIYYGTTSGVYTQSETYSRNYTGYIYYTPAGLADCTDYYVAVSAYDLSGNESARSTEIFLYNGKAGAPSAPTGLTATSDDSGIKLLWNPSPECDVQWYHVYRRAENDPDFIHIGTVTEPAYIDNRIVNGVTYYYKVQAEDEERIYSNYSLEQSATAVDTTPPQPPANVYVRSYSGANYLKITWSRNTEPDIAGYRIYYGTSSGNYTQTVDVGNSSYYYLYGLEGCTLYYIAVSAYDLSGNESGLSEEKSATLTFSSTLQAPSGLTASSGESRIILTWNANPECDVWRYRIFRSTVSGSGYQELDFVQRETTYEDRRIANGTTYYYVIKAENYAGTLSPASQEVSAVAVDKTPPEPPAWIGVSVNDDAVSVQWSSSPSPDVKEYRIFYGTEPGNYSGSITSALLHGTITGLQDCRDYYIAVKAVDLSGLISAFSKEIVTRTYQSGIPQAPTGLGGEFVTGGIRLTWAANPECDIREYRIYRSLVPGGGYQHVGSTKNTTYTDSNGLSSDTTYYYVVRAMDLSGQTGDVSAEVSVTTGDLTPPSPPALSSDIPLVTRQPRPVLRGTKDPDSSILINGTEVVPVNSNSTWEATVSLTRLHNQFDITSKDPYGNESAPLRVEIIWDTRSPEIASSVPSDGSVTKDSVSTITIRLKDAFSGIDLTASVEGASVKNQQGVEIPGQWSTSGTDTLVFTPASAMAEGVYTVTILPVDSLGNKGTATFTFAVDTTPATVESLVMTPDSPHRAEAVTFLIRFNEDMDRTVQPKVTFSRGLLYTDYTLTGTWTDNRTWRGTYLFTPDMGDGTYTVTVSGARDRAGNIISSQDAGSFVLDTVAPAPPTVNQVTTPTNLPNQTVTGTKEPDTAIVINNKPVVPLDASSTWSYRYPLSEGENTLTVVARDRAGNDSGPVTVSITLDTTPPVFTVDDYQPASTEPTQTIAGAKEPGCTVKLNGNQIFGPDDVNSAWTYTVDLIEGIPNRFTFTASDALGNTTEKTIEILYDRSAPPELAPGVLVADGNGRGTEVTLTWDAYIEEPDVAYYRIYVSATDFTDIAGLSPVGTTDRGVKTYKVTGLTEGSTYYFGVVPVDASGNYNSSVNTASAIPTDTLPPEDVTIISVSAGYDAAKGNYITITWAPSIDSAGDLADQIIYFDDGTGYDSGTSLGKTATEYTKTGLRDATKYKFRITTRDDGGMESSGVIAEGVTRLGNPSDITATPGNQKVTLAWMPVNSPYVRHYNIYRIASDTQQRDVRSMTLIHSTTTNTYTDTGLNNGTTYQYAVTVVNTSGAERTDVMSIAATPREDETGPEITLDISEGQVLTAPITIHASATDAESAMDRIELYIDDHLIKSEPGGSLSYLYNVVETTDGNHTLRLVAYDSLGNSSELLRRVIVSLAPPETPVITGHTVVQSSPQYLVEITGRASLSTTVTLRVNGVVVSQIETPDSGLFTFSSIKLSEGDNIIDVKASHRGGESAYSSGYKITVDTGAPPPPQNLTAERLPGGLIRFTWSNGDGEIPSGYNLYMSSTEFTSKSDSGLQRVNTTPVRYLLKEYLPPDDTLRYYAVTALDSAGNESEISNLVSLSSDRVAPSVTSVQYHYYGQNGLETSSATVAGPGTVRVTVTVSEPLREPPFFSLEPASGSPIVLSMSKVDEVTYEGSFEVTSRSPHGPTRYKFSAKDMVGNRGTAEAEAISLDVQGPVATVESPVNILQIRQEPVRVQVVFDEPTAAVPSLQLKASDGQTTSPVTGLVSDDGVHWSGTVDVSTLPEGRAEFVLLEAKDGFGNTGTTVASGRTILLYRDTVPPPDAPQGLTAKSEKGGVITLSWDPVVYEEISATITYNLYRRAEGESTPVKIMSGIAGPPVQDTPPEDGIYYYSISSTGILDSESERSAEVQAISDRTGPEGPVNLSLSFDSSGVTATWEMPPGEVPASYRLYRSDAPIITTDGLTPVAGSTLTKAVDTAPRQSQRFYAVTALDALGNEGPPSESVEITFPVSPVRELVLERFDDGAPRLSWKPPADGGIMGYHIYRNGNRITDYPVNILSYSDGYYSGGTITYGVSAVDSLGNESPVKEVTLPELSMGLKEGTILRRGLLETVQVILKNNHTGALKIDLIELQAGGGDKSLLKGPFNLAPGEEFIADKVVSTEPDAPAVISVLITAVWSPSPGSTVKIHRNASADVTGSGTALEIFSEPLVRGTEAEVRLKINNTGSALMEFLTSENNGETRRVRVVLKDEDGNILSTGYLNQRTGSGIVNIGKYAVARLNPGESILTVPVRLQVPDSAPYRVVLEAEIENTYYRYGKPEQVTAPGLRQSMEATVSETAYRAYAEPEYTFYSHAQPVIITGQAINNTTEQPMPNVPVKIGISVKGFDRFYTVTTDSEGRFTFTFEPGENEAGTYSVWAVHPDVKTRAVQSTFTIAGLRIEPGIANVRMVRNRPVEIPITVTNTGDTPVTGVTFAAETSPGITAEIVNKGDDLFEAGEKTKVIVRLTASDSAADTGFATVNVSGQPSGGTGSITATFDAAITVVRAIPIISTRPSYIDTGMVRGGQKIVSFTITNRGEDTLRNARVEGPSTSWMSLTVGRDIGDLPPGGSRKISLYFRPPADLAQGVYDDRIVIYSDNHIPYTYHIQVTVTSDAVGSVLFDVLNELMEDVAGATVTIQNQMLPELMYTVKTGDDGTAMLYDIPEGRYTFMVSAPGHLSYSGSFNIYPGLTTTVPVALEVTLVEVEWTVTPIVIEDRYEIVIHQTFETHVPTPVLVTEPASITLPEMAPGEVFNGEFTITNYGLIALDEVKIDFPGSFRDYDIEILTTLPERLNAMESITVPYRITRRQSVAAIQHPVEGIQGMIAEAEDSINHEIGAMSQALSTMAFTSSSNHLSQLLNEVRGYGGGSCYTSFRISIAGTATICPDSANERKTNKSTSFTVIVPLSGSSCGGGGITSGSYTDVVIVGGGGGGTQSGGGWLPGGEPVVLDIEECGSTDLPRCTGTNCPDVCTNSVVKLSSGTYEDGYVDITVKTAGIPISFQRYYTSRWTTIGRLPQPTGASAGSGGGTTIRKKYVRSVGGYAGAREKPSPQAYGWTSPWFAMITGGGGGLAYFDGYGQIIYFVKNQGGYAVNGGYGAKRYVAELGIQVLETPTGYQVRDKSGLRRNFMQLEDRGPHRLVSVEDGRGNRVSLNYDSEGRLVSITDATGVVALTFSYNEQGFITQVTDRDGRTVNYTVDEMGRLLEVTGPLGQKYTYEYDQVNSYFRLLKKTDPEGNVTRIEYRQGQLVVSRVIEPDGNERSFDYNFEGRTFYYTDTRGITTTYTINRQGKLTSVRRAGKTVMTIEYLEGRVERVTDGAGNTYEVRKNERYDPVEITDPEGNVTRIEYNQYWKVARITDPLGNVTEFEYNQYEELTGIRYPDGTEVRIEYDSMGNPVRITRGQSTWQYEYDSRGNVTKVTAPEGNVTLLGYDRYGFLSSIIDALGNTTEITNNIMGWPVTVKDPLGNTKTYSYDRKGNLISVTDEAGNTTTYTYDFKGRVTSVTDALGNRTEYRYDGEGNLLKITNLTPELTPLSSVVMTYDVLNRLESITDPEGNITRYSYSGSFGCPACPGASTSLPARITDPLGNTTIFSFDRNGRVVGVKDPENNITTYAYDAVGRITSRIDGNGNITHYRYDSMGRITKQIDASGGETIFRYDERGNLIALTDPNGNTTTFAYDRADRLIRETRPMGQVIEYTYYPNGLLKTVKDAKGQVTTYSYDAAGRLTEITYSDGKKETFTYDARGNLISYTGDGVSGTITYDSLGRKLSETVDFGAFSKTYSYTYDSLGNKATFTSPEGITYTYTYNKNNQPTGIAFDGKSINLNYQWNRLIKITLPNGITTDYQYNKNSWLTYITAKNATSTLLDLRYEFDRAGNILGKTTEQGNYTYTYDVLYQLTKVQPPGLFTEEYTYDRAGNRLTSASTTGNWTYNANNELIGFDTVTYEYDENGNLTKQRQGTQTTVFSYNGANRLESVILPDGRTATYTYDPFGRRIKKDVDGQVTYYLYADEGLIGEYDETGTLIRAYGWMPDSIWGTNPIFIHQNGSYYYYHNDHLGTPQKITDINGNEVWSAEYTAFGEATVTGSLTNNLRFPGQYYDAETGLHYNWQRYYNPLTGRYTQVDPIGFAAGLNLYTYSLNNPLRFIDSDGRFSEWYTGQTGVQVHNMFFEWVKRTYGQKGVKFDRPLSEIGLGFSMNRPDVINKITRKVWELKPITHINNPQRDIDQLNRYLDELRGKGYVAGEPTELVHCKTTIGTVWGPGGPFARQYEVTIYPGNEKGLIYYALNPTGKIRAIEWLRDLRRVFELYDPAKDPFRRNPIGPPGPIPGPIPIFP